MLFNNKKTLNQSVEKSGRYIKIDDEKRLVLQSILLEIYDDIILICEKIGIQCYLVGGSALGAVRHRGFIPWDDDLDIAMTRKDYLAFKNVFDKEAGDKYILNAPNYSAKVIERFPKVIKRNTVFEQVIGIHDKELTGIFVDIFIIDSVPNNLLIRTVKGIICNAAEYIAGRVANREYSDENYQLMLREKQTFRANVCNKINTFVGWCFSFKKATFWFNIVDRMVSTKNNNSKYYSIATGRGHYFGEIQCRDVFFPGAKGEFCGRSVTLPNKVDIYLKSLYGNYMRIPSENNRESHYVKKIEFNTQ